MEALEVWNLKNPPTPYHIQALLESLGGLASLNRLSGSALVYSKWHWKGYVAGLYEASHMPLVRRVTGGLGIKMEPSGTYISIIKNSKSIFEIQKFIKDIVGCLGYKFEEGELVLNGSSIGTYGITRFGFLGNKAPAIAEILIKNDLNLEAVLKCIIDLNEISEVIERKDPTWASLSRSAKGYSSSTWRVHVLSNIPYRNLVKKGKYFIEIAVAETECFISYVSLAGRFFASPPSEPFNVLSSIIGMPIREDVIDAARFRAENYLELYGIDLNDFLDALQGALKATGCLEI